MPSYPESVLTRLHEAELEILDAISAVCEEEGISWYLVAGSALGAARHNGFIPWDDDIDIGMLRDDYDRFLEVAPEKLGERFEVLSPRTTPNYAPMFAKVCLKNTRFQSKETIDTGLDSMAIFVDLFPREHLAADDRARKRQQRKGFIYTTESYLYHSKHVVGAPPGIAGKIARALYPAVHAILRIVTSEDAIRRKYARATKLAPGVALSGMTESLSTPGFEPLPEDKFLEPDLHEFEGRMFPVPHDIEDYLNRMYGPNWRELPPEDKRVNHAPLILDFGDGINVMKSSE